MLTEEDYDDLWNSNDADSNYEPGIDPDEMELDALDVEFEELEAFDPITGEEVSALHADLLESEPYDGDGNGVEQEDGVSGEDGPSPGREGRERAGRRAAVGRAVFAQPSAKFTWSRRRQRAAKRRRAFGSQSRLPAVVLGHIRTAKMPRLPGGIRPRSRRRNILRGCRPRMLQANYR
jgi:hypothetical protein